MVIGAQPGTGTALAIFMIDKMPKMELALAEIGGVATVAAVFGGDQIAVLVMNPQT
nr:hypothetical protein [Glaciimonas sp. PAMC28666]